jgi:hypothetical protein
MRTIRIRLFPVVAAGGRSRATVGACFVPP